MGGTSKYGDTRQYSTDTEMIQIGLKIAEVTLQYYSVFK